jgi:hypothetical protein
VHLNHGWHLTYCTNVHRGESWAEILANLQRHTLPLRDRIRPGHPFGIGLRLGEPAARQLADPKTLTEFRHWLDRNSCYVFTINGFSYGRFHGIRVKEQVYAPDWALPERLEYTNVLFDILAQLLPPDIPGTVTTLAASFKPWVPTPAYQRRLRDQIWQSILHVAQLSDRTGQDLTLALEPEPFCLLESAADILRFFDQLRSEHPRDSRLDRHLGINYDAGHQAVQFDHPATAFDQLDQYAIRLAKVQLTSALKARPSTATRQVLTAFNDSTYLHPVVSRDPSGALTHYHDLDDALATPTPSSSKQVASSADLPEWRIHFRIPLHSQPRRFFDQTHDRHQTDFFSALDQADVDSTTDHLMATLDWLAAHPEACAHLEIETHTWEILPPELKERHVIDQLSAEYRWTLDHLARRQILPA